jgi:uncharacterized protein
MRFSSKNMSRSLALFSLFGMVAVWLIGSALTGATNSKVAPAAAPAMSMQLNSEDGMRIAATYWPGASPTAPAILLLHGNGGNRGNMAGLATMLAADGYAVLAIDFRGHGESTPASKSFGLFEAHDARAAFDWLRARNPDRKIGIIGYSLGGAASLIGEHGPIPADALVLEGVYPDIRRAIFNRLATRLGSVVATAVEPVLSYQSLPRFGVWPSDISPIDALAKVTKPVMIIGGEADTNTPPSETKAMFAALKGRGELHILAGVNHKDLGGPPSRPLKVALLAFLNRTLRAEL